ncbi:uncharacterized protein [Notamacropus eugenii]|uniref:uncharacterized protein n=1 Tax=Notamacropus eugenii TaxID=9315 RepID=UPI003B681B23
MDNKILQVQKFLENGSLPEHLVTPTQKRDFRRRAQNFALEGHNLMFIRPGKKLLVVLDRKDRQELVKQAHVTSSGLHCTLQETKKKVSFSYYWPTLDQDVTKWVKQCNCCQKPRLEKSLPIQGVSKSHRNKDPLPVLQVEEVTQAFEQVGLGLVGPLVETSNGFRFILLSVDAYSRWVEASPLKEQNPVEVAWALIPFLLRFGRPQLLVTTLRVPFVSQVNRSLQRQLQGLGVPLGKLDIVMSAFQPKINSILSLTSSSIRRTLWSLVKGDLGKWDCVLDKALFSLRTAVTKNKRKSPFQLLYGRKPRAPQDVPPHFDVVAADTVGDSGGDSHDHDDKEPMDTAETMKHILKSPVPKVMGQAKKETTWEPTKPLRQEPIPESRQQPVQPEPRQQPVQLEPRQPSRPETMGHLMHQSMPESVNQHMWPPILGSIHQSIQQPMTQSMYQPMTQPMYQLITQSTYQPITQSTYQPMIPSTYQPMIQSTYHPMTQSTHQPMTQTTHQPMTQTIQQPMTQTIQQPMTQTIQQPMTQTIQQPMTQTMQQPIMAEPTPPPMPRLTECPVVSSWGQETTISLDTPWEKWEPGGGVFWTQWREPGN